MVDLLLIYPYFSHDNSLFKFPPLGLGQIAAYVMDHSYSVQILDCTFMKEEDVVRRAMEAKARIIGISCMSSMEETAIRLAHRLRGCCELLVAGGSLPTAVPSDFTDHFDLVVIGEGEETMLEILRDYGRGNRFEVDGVVYLEEGKIKFTRPGGSGRIWIPYPSPRGTFSSTAPTRLTSARGMATPYLP